MSKMHTVRLHPHITVYSDMFNHMDAIIRNLVEKKNQWKQELFFAMKLARQKLSKHHAELTPMTGMLLNSVYILDPFQKLRSLESEIREWIFILRMRHPILLNTERHFLQYVDNEYNARHRHVPVSKLDSLPSCTFVTSAKASGSCQTSFDPYDLSSDDVEYLTPNYVAGITPGWSDHAVCYLTATRLNWILQPEVPKTWGQINSNLNDYHSDPMENTCTFSIPDITDWWCQQKDMHSKYANTSNMACDMFSIIPHCVGVEAGFSHVRNIIAWSQSKTTGHAVRKMSLLGTLLEPIMVFWQAITQHRIQSTNKTTLKCSKRCMKGNCTEWLSSTTFWTCGSAAKTCMLYWRNLTFKTCRWQL